MSGGRSTPAIRRSRNGQRWEARYRDPSGHQRGKTFDRKVDAENYLAAVKADMARGDWQDPALRKVPLAKVVHLWLPSLADLQPTTRAQREQDLRLRILPRFGQRAVGSITDFDVRALKADLLGSGLAPATVTKCLMTLSLIFKAAVVNGYVPRNPCDMVKKPGDQPVEETIFLDAAQVNDLAAACEPRYAPMVLLAGYRGLRFGEVAGLRPARVDLLHARLDVVEALKEVRGELYFGPPKHGRRRTVPLPPFLVTALRRHIEEFPPRNELVFPSEGGFLLRRSNFSRRIWQPAVRAAGVDDRLTFHGLRHSAVSILISRGASVVELAAIMGWSRSTAAAMAVRYGHLFEAREHHLTDAVEAAYQEAKANTSTPGDVV